MTIKQAQMALRPFNITLKRISETNEYRVNLAGGTEATAYYTNDINDAVDTGRAMANFRDAKKGSN